MRIDGQNETLKALEQERQRILASAQTEVSATAYEILNEAKESTPVKNNFLRGSGFADIQGLNATVGFNKEYAPYVEFGTGGTVNIPPNWEDFASQFKGKGIKTINLKARPYLIPAFEKGIKGFNQRMNGVTLKNTTI
jgi:hypothetical protein